MKTGASPLRSEGLKQICSPGRLGGERERESKGGPFFLLNVITIERGESAGGEKSNRVIYIIPFFRTHNNDRGEKKKKKAKGELDIIIKSGKIERGDHHT